MHGLGAWVDAVWQTTKDDDSKRACLCASFVPLCNCFIHRLLLGLHHVSISALCFGHRICLSVCLSPIRSRKLSEIGAKFHHLCRKLGLPSKNMTSDFAPEVAKYPKSSYFGSVRAYCFAPLAVQLVISLSCWIICSSTV